VSAPSLPSPAPSVGARPAGAAPRLARALASTAALVAVAAVLLVGLLAATGQPSGAALAALWRGSVGSSDAFVSGTLVRATPLVLAGLAVALAFRAGVLNVGAEGQLLAGAGAAAAAGGLLAPALGGAAVVAALAAGTAAGAAWAGVAGGCAGGSACSR
jgi:simple sugar transport system permease protein